MTNTDESGKTGRQHDDGPATIGGHVSHLGGARLVVLVLAAALLYWLFSG